MISREYMVLCTFLGSKMEDQSANCSLDTMLWRVGWVVRVSMTSYDLTCISFPKSSSSINVAKYPSSKAILYLGM